MAKKKVVKKAPARKRTAAKKAPARQTRTSAEHPHRPSLHGAHRPLVYNRPLLMLPFDHRGSFARDLLGITGVMTPAQRERVSELKDIVYRGFRLVADEVPDRASYAILADEEYAAHVLRDARNDGFTVSMPVEKSGQEEFMFDTPEWKKAIERFNPHIVKALVRYNPRGDAALNKRQLVKLKQVADYCHKTHRLFLFELLVPPTSAQKKSYGDKYDAALRPALEAEAIGIVHAAGVDVDIWKIEALARDDWRAVIAATKRAPRVTQPVFIVLGRNAARTTVDTWLHDAAAYDEVVGFAVGRTVFYEPLERYIAQKIGKEVAARQIAMRFKHFNEVWRSSKKARLPSHRVPYDPLAHR